MTPLFQERLLAQNDSPDGNQPFITIAIPHYKQRRYLELVLASIFEQDFADLEIVVSNDQSPDDSDRVIPDILSESGRPFRYYSQPKNLGYDGNVRFCLAAAQGRYVMLLGNDDALAGPQTISQIVEALAALDFPTVAFANYSDWASGELTRRALSTQILGKGPEMAVQFFRSFSFVAGLIFDQAATHEHETDRWDHSIFYQIYLASRVIASGGVLAALDVNAVRKDVRVDEQHVFNYETKWADAPWSFQPRHTGMESVIRVTVDGVTPLVSAGQRSQTIRQIVQQILTVTYPYWLMEYRRVANWSFAVGVAREMWIGKLLAEYRSLKFTDRLKLWFWYLTATIGGLLLPRGWFEHIKSQLAEKIRRNAQEMS
ncbi:MAG: glycosyltransferase family 2 protein [Ardenticatenaceae bacterium]|nr:glycosyltransferase family 2 protein [Ardenticatenaceae bacterium]